MKFNFEKTVPGKMIFLSFFITTILFSFGCEPPRNEYECYNKHKLKCSGRQHNGKCG